MITMTYKVGVAGDINDRQIFQDESSAIQHAKQVWNSENANVFLGTTSEVSVAVYGQATYTEDDPTPVYARTYFWRAWRKDRWGFVSEDGR